MLREVLLLDGFLHDSEVLLRHVEVGRVRIVVWPLVAAKLYLIRRCRRLLRWPCCCLLLNPDIVRQSRVSAAVRCLRLRLLALGPI